MPYLRGPSRMTEDELACQRRELALGTATMMVRECPDLMRTTAEIKGETTGDEVVVRVARNFLRFLEGDNAEGDKATDGDGGTDQGPQG
jgi:hypothetical protein